MPAAWMMYSKSPMSDGSGWIMSCRRRCRAGLVCSAVSRGGVGRLVPVQCRQDEIVAQKAGAPGDEQILAGQPTDLVAQIAADVVQITVEQLFEPWQRG